MRLAEDRLRKRGDANFHRGADAGFASQRDAAASVRDAENGARSGLAQAESGVPDDDAAIQAGVFCERRAAGAFTPTECLLAHEFSADFVKLFPAEQLGPAFIKSIRAPLPMLRIISTGGVTPETEFAFIEAGCVALGAGRALYRERFFRIATGLPSALVEKFARNSGGAECASFGLSDKCV